MHFVWLVRRFLKFKCSLQAQWIMEKIIIHVIIHNDIDVNAPSEQTNKQTNR